MNNIPEYLKDAQRVARDAHTTRRNRAMEAAINLAPYLLVILGVILIIIGWMLWY